MLKAGFGKSIITPRVGARLMGYANRTSPSIGVHDDLCARALALESNGDAWVLCAVDLCYLREPQVKAVREIVEQKTGFPADRIFLCAVHTHSGPDDQDGSVWNTPLTELIANSVIEATERMRPAQFGVGSGFLDGWSINRRWLDRPVDPFIGAVRIDDKNGRPMGAVSNFGCHAVVLGYDNLLISADWPGVTCEVVEKALGPEAVCIVTQGGSGDVNPLTNQVRARLQSGISIGTMKGRVYYGNPKENFAWHIGDRGGGTFEEARELGTAVADEVLHIMSSVKTHTDVHELWTHKITLDGSRQPSEPTYSSTGEIPGHITERPNPPDPDGKRRMEFMMMGAEELGFIVIGQPGDVFAETVVATRRQLQTMGYVQPWTVGYANGWHLYLPPEFAYPEGGYEVNWAVHLGISSKLQSRVWEAMHPILSQHVHT